MGWSAQQGGGTDRRKGEDGLRGPQQARQVDLRCGIVVRGDGDRDERQAEKRRKVGVGEARLRACVEAAMASRERRSRQGDSGQGEASRRGEQRSNDMAHLHSSWPGEQQQQQQQQQMRVDGHGAVNLGIMEEGQNDSSHESSHSGHECGGNARSHSDGDHEGEGGEQEMVASKQVQLEGSEAFAILQALLQ